MIVVRRLLGLSFCLVLISLSSATRGAQGEPALQFQALSEAAPLPAPAAPPTPIRFEAAVLKAANDLLSKVTLDDSQAKVDVVIDPLIDGVTPVLALQFTLTKSQPVGNASSTTV